MKYTITGKSYNVTDGLREVLVNKMARVEKVFNEDVLANILVSTVGNKKKIEVTIPVKGNVIRAEETAETLHEAVDLVIDKLERQLVKYRHKIIDKHRYSGSFRKEFIDKYEEDDEEFETKIVKVKKFPVKPMDPEEACLQLEMLGHDFFMFRNSETDDVCLVYKRKGGDFGLIEPEV